MRMWLFSNFFRHLTVFTKDETLTLCMKKWWEIVQSGDEEFGDCLLSTDADRQGVDISFTVCLCVCTVTYFSADDKASGVKFCSAVHRRPNQGITNLCDLCYARKPKIGRIGQRAGHAHDTRCKHYRCNIHCVSKKRPTCKLSLTLSNLNRFSKFLHCWKAYEICYKTIWQYPPYLRHVATLPWEIKHSNFLQIFSRYGRK